MRSCFGDHGFLSRVTALRVDLLVAIKIIRLEIFTGHQTGTSTREVVIETKQTLLQTFRDQLTTNITKVRY